MYHIMEKSQLHSTLPDAKVKEVIINVTFGSLLWLIFKRKLCRYTVTQEVSFNHCYMDKTEYAIKHILLSWYIYIYNFTKKNTVDILVIINIAGDFCRNFNDDITKIENTNNKRFGNKGLIDMLFILVLITRRK